MYYKNMNDQQQITINCATISKQIDSIGQDKHLNHHFLNFQWTMHVLQNLQWPDFE